MDTCKFLRVFYPSVFSSCVDSFCPPLAVDLRWSTTWLLAPWLVYDIPVFFSGVVVIFQVERDMAELPVDFLRGVGYEDYGM